VKKSLYEELVSDCDVVIDEDDETEGERKDEFSGAGGVAGMTLPLGMSPQNTKRKKSRSRVNEQGTRSTKVSDGVDDQIRSLIRCVLRQSSGYSLQDYYTSVGQLSKYYGGSDNPFGESRSLGMRRAKEFLTPQYPKTAVE